MPNLRPRSSRAPDEALRSDPHVMPALVSRCRRSTIVSLLMSLPCGRCSTSVSAPTVTLNLPSCSSVTVPTASSSDCTCRHSMLPLAGCRMIFSSVLRCSLPRSIGATLPSFGHAEHDVARLLAGLDVAGRFDDLVDVVRSVDHRPVFAGVDELLDE